MLIASRDLIECIVCRVLFALSSFFFLFVPKPDYAYLPLILPILQVSEAVKKILMGIWPKPPAWTEARVATPMVNGQGRILRSPSLLKLPSPLRPPTEQLPHTDFHKCGYCHQPPTGIHVY